MMGHLSSQIVRNAFVLGAILTIGLPTSGQAAIQTFYGLDGGAGNGGAHPNSDAARSQFLAALGSYAVGTQDFESLPGNGFGLIGQSVAFPNISATGLFGQSGGIGNAVVEDNLSPEFPISGSNYLYTVIGPNRPFFEISFSEPVFGLGFYGVGVSDYFGFPGVTPEYVNLDGGSPIGILNVDPATVPNSSVNFFGVISSTPFTTVRFYNPGPSGDSIGIDDLTIATAVPEANSSVLLVAAATGLVGSWFLRNSKHKPVSQS